MRAGALFFDGLPPLSLYIHLPWCARKCPYCDFNSHQIGQKQDRIVRFSNELLQEKPIASQRLAADQQNRYLAALLADLHATLPLIWGRPVQTVFMGGGTPSLFSPDVIAQLISEIRAVVPLVPDCEITMEANPGSFETDRFKAYRQAGVTRLSIGVQSFNDQHLQAIGRVHDRAQAIAAIEEASRHFDSFNLDVMYALPGQSLGQFAQDLNMALAFEPPHLSVYQLTLEANTFFAKYPPQLPHDDDAYAMLDHILEKTAERGLQRYEVSAFARNDTMCRHNRNYWQFGDYIGIGAGAHGKLTFPNRVVRHVKVRDPELYMNRALLDGDGALASEVQVSRAELPFEFMLGALRLVEGVALNQFQERTGLPIGVIQKALTVAREKGFMTHDSARLQATPLGLDFLSDLQALFLPDE